MQLSIIIVNYNVKFFLEQCLYSVIEAVAGIEAEIFVVDNASQDGSVEYLQPKFPAVHFIANQQNEGFAKANNSALNKCAGDYVLFLNPDTLLPEDCFMKCLSFISNVPNAGALGIRMVDGSGRFLPESKRSFPNPLTSLYKLVGLNALFPKSKIFARYSLGYLDEHKNHEVDVLAGAFMLVKREVILKLNGFDETFFMYGEDIDLSYRIQKLGYKNYYFSGSSIIHFKGESTRKGSLNYVRMFYQAMRIFVHKHYSGSRASIFIFFIQLAIWARAAMSAVSRFILKIGLPLIDAIIIYASFKLVNFFWIKYMREGAGFITDLVNIALPVFALVFLTTASLAGIYDNKYKPLKAFYAASLATVVMLAVYSLLPERLRFSRGVILFGGLTALVLISFFRWLLLKFRVVEETDETKKHQQTIIVATKPEFEEVVELMGRSNIRERIMGRVAANGNKEDALGTLEQLKTLAQTIQLREVIFCKGYLTYAKIIDTVQQLPQTLSIRFHANGSGSIVGSDSKDTSGEIFSAETAYQILDPYQRRMKRLLDVSFSLFILATFPLQILFGFSILRNALLVLFNRRTWVGYAGNATNLPLIKKSIINTTGQSANASTSLNEESLYQINKWYAQNYDWTDDGKIILNNYKRLNGNNN